MSRKKWIRLALIAGLERSVALWRRTNCRTARMKSLHSSYNMHFSILIWNAWWPVRHQYGSTSSWLKNRLSAILKRKDGRMVRIVEVWHRTSHEVKIFVQSQSAMACLLEFKTSKSCYRKLPSLHLQDLSICSKKKRSEMICHAASTPAHRNDMNCSTNLTWRHIYSSSWLRRRASPFVTLMFSCMAPETPISSVSHILPPDYHNE